MFSGCRLIGTFWKQPVKYASSIAANKSTWIYLFFFTCNLNRNYLKGYYFSMFFSNIYRVDNDCLLAWISFLYWSTMFVIKSCLKFETKLMWEFNIALKMLNQESDSVSLLRAISSPWSRSLQAGPFLGVGELGDRPRPRVQGGPHLQVVLSPRGSLPILHSG